ncbi:MAG: GtrA-like protein [Syntrophorhabdaceae bacterium PtaU1.Bin034]|nr:MAG: GtrA-like protein [Syntrophorhabdaceae bacterium PtaU1.Bin034]
MIARSIAYFSRDRTLIARFGLVGIITFALNCFLLWLFYGVAALDYRIAVSIAYVLVVVAHFLLNRAFTYKARGSSILGQVGKYTGMLISNYFLTLIITMCTVELCSLSPYWGAVFATMASAVSSFILMKHFVFYD